MRHEIINLVLDPEDSSGKTRRYFEVGFIVKFDGNTIEYNTLK
jgi:hypothetical protein